MGSRKGSVFFELEILTDYFSDHEKETYSGCKNKLVSGLVPASFLLLDIMTVVLKMHVSDVTLEFMSTCLTVRLTVCVCNFGVMCQPNEGVPGRIILHTHMIWVTVIHFNIQSVDKVHKQVRRSTRGRTTRGRTTRGLVFQVHISKSAS